MNNILIIGSAVIAVVILALLCGYLSELTKGSLDDTPPNKTDSN